MVRNEECAIVVAAKTLPIEHAVPIRYRRAITQKISASAPGHRFRF
jgi:hypothetical protein